MKKRAKTTLRILAFGDSLTDGYILEKRSHPYSIQLKSKLQELESVKDVNFEIEVEGVPGEEVDEMVERLEFYLQDCDYYFDFILILGGTNNLDDSEGEFIYQSLEKLHKIALSHNNITKTVAISIPELYFRNGLWENEKRIKVNNQLKKLSEENERILFFDLSSLIPNCSNPKTRDQFCFAHYWSDNIHFSEEGYDRFGLLLFQFLSPFIVSKFNSPE